MLYSRKLAGAVALALGLVSITHATGNPNSTFSNVIAFGDSLSDAGNISLSEVPSFQPPQKFTTNPGTITVQNIAAGLGYTLTASLADGNDYAWGGAGINNNSPGTPAGVPTITTQVNTYLAGHPSLDSRALYTMWGGANDIFYATTTPATAQTQIIAAAQQEVKLLGELQAAGAKNILVFNLPNVGLSPEATEAGSSAASALTTLSIIYNGQLNSGLGQLGKGIIPVNAFALLNQVIANPAAYGFSNVTEPACGVGSNSVLCGPQGSGLPYTYAPGTNNSYLFADGVHPTTGADRMLAQVVLSELAAPQQISLLQEAPLAAITTQTSTVRTQMMADNFGSPTRAFASINYSNQQFDQSAGAPKTTSNNVDLTLGVDVHANDYISTGVALGIGEHYADVSGGGGYDLQALTGLGYLTWHDAGAYAGIYGDFGQASYTNINRVFMVGDYRTHESGKTDGSYYGLGLHGGYWFDVGSLKTGPFANFEYQNIHIDGYNESGNDATAMWFGRQERNALISTLGWRLQGHWQYNAVNLQPYVELGWNHDSRASTDMVTAGLNSMNGSFEMAGFTPDKNWGSANVGLVAQFTPNLSGWIAYNGHFSDNSQRYNAINLGMKFGF
ncbi:autotransporter domain-containing protein [Dyella sp. M7H15-1]|uniref:autotransporter outer membrane beta-barrel domain-containing protein n=1 Tax=Dyella sp. M7H15-1 TaxID=2501295 RepID=UPI001004E363|nr:autotransporter domain-containing protein [Dyella sp. M7H15-1]QAU24158.1 autotransporter domain-containing protein [Dyella sp. M7H15-1]